MIRCSRPTHTLSLFFSLPPSFSLTHSSLSFSDSLCLFFPDISWLKSLFLLMFRKVHIYSTTHPLTRSQKYLPSHKCHINSPFLRVRYQFKKTPKSHANTLYDVLWHCHYAPKKIASGAGLRRLCEVPVFQLLFKTYSQPFPQKPVLNTFIPFQILFPRLYASRASPVPGKMSHAEGTRTPY